MGFRHFTTLLHTTRTHAPSESRARTGRAASVRMWQSNRRSFQAWPRRSSHSRHPCAAGRFLSATACWPVCAMGVLVGGELCLSTCASLRRWVGGIADATRSRTPVFTQWCKHRLTLSSISFVGTLTSPWDNASNIQFENPKAHRTVSSPSGVWVLVARNFATIAHMNSSQ